MTWLHRSAILLSALTVVLLVAGALVTSTGTGLSVPTWPATLASEATPGLGSGAAFQQTHRILASLVGLLTLVVTVLAFRADPRPWMRSLTVAALALVVAQAVYGGIGVVNGLPVYFSVLHAAFAQLFLGLVIAVALFTSRGWLQATRAGEAGGSAGDSALRRLALTTTIAIYVQLLLGAAMRHTYGADGRPAGLAIPDYPLAFGRILPLDQIASWAVGLDFAHRLTALATAALVCATAVRVFRRHVTE